MSVGLRHLRAFLAVAEQESITDAAAVLGVTQPAVSRMLQELENHLGIELVSRSTHHLVVTAAGERYRVRAAAAVRAVTQVLDPDSGRTRPIRVGHAWAAFGASTPAVISQWRVLHPNSPIELHRYDDRLAGLESGSVDVAIVRDLDPDLAEPLTRAWVAAEQRVAALPADHPLAAQESVTLKDFAEEKIVVNIRSGTTTMALWSDAGVAKPAGVVEVTNTDDWLFTIAAGDGVGITSVAIAHMAQTPNVTYRPLTGIHNLTVELAWLEPASHPLIRDLVQHAANLAAPVKVGQVRHQGDN